MPFLVRPLFWLLLPWLTLGCDLEAVFSDREVSLEESVFTSEIVFRGLTIAASKNHERVLVELINTYKGAEVLDVYGAGSDRRRFNVTLPARPGWDCDQRDDVPRKYILFCNLVIEELQAAAIAKWDDIADQRVWVALGWSEWSDWSSCSVSCSLGIQQRTRHCLHSQCPGYNIEQRHCNLFGCEVTVNPLAVRETRFFHPSRARWQPVPDRATAWRLRPNSYIWLPSAQLFPLRPAQTVRPFPREFSLFITIRVLNSTMGTIFSLRSRRRQDSYLSLELAGPDLKLIHATSNGTDVVRINAKLMDGKWHQVAISIRETSTVESYVDCEWSKTEILRSHTLDIPDDADIIIGYLFVGDLEQLSIVADPSFVNLQCSSLRTPIIDSSFRDDNQETKPLSTSRSRNFVPGRKTHDAKSENAIST